jgi:hypothetical protein
MDQRLKLGGNLSEPAVGPCLCELASGPVRKLQGTGAKFSDKIWPVWVGIWPCEKARDPEKQYSRFPDGFVSFRCK